MSLVIFASEQVDELNVPYFCSSSNKINKKKKNDTPILINIIVL